MSIWWKYWEVNETCQHEVIDARLNSETLRAKLQRRANKLARTT